MTKKELIEELKDMDDDSTIVLSINVLRDDICAELVFEDPDGGYIYITD